MKDKRSPSADMETLIPLLIGVWRRLHQEPGPADYLQTREFRRVVEAIKTIESHAAEGKSLNEQDYFCKPDLLGAYLLYQWVIHYQQGLSLIGELPTTPRRVLEVCSGPAAFSFAALRQGAREVYATDRNEKALLLGAEVCGRYGLPLSIRKWDCLKENLPLTGQFDLIIVAHCLQELFPSNQKNYPHQQSEFLYALFERLTPDGYLLIVDSSFLEANKRVLTLRDKMVQKGVPVQAPCVWHGECPALKSPNNPCYAQREMEKPSLIKQLQRAANINLSSLKMSYVIFRHPQAKWPELPEERLYRVISPPVEGYQGKRYYLCGIDGKKNLGSHLPSPSPREIKAFDYLKRGELISIGAALEQVHSLDLIQHSTLTLKAACGKPLPEKETSHEEDSF